MSRKNISYVKGYEHSDFTDFLNELQEKNENNENQDIYRHYDSVA